MAKFMRRLSKRFQNDASPSSSVAADGPEPENTLMIEAFEWYTPADRQHWKRIADALPSLKELGVDKIWIPPACKAGNPTGNGYDVYDLYDLGEFDQKGSVATKWGTKDELVQLSRAARAQGIGLVFDAVLNHKAAADYTQHVDAQRVHPEDRRRAMEKPHQIEAWLGFNYDGREGKYSQLKHTASHFNGTNYDNTTKSDGIYRLSGKEWAKDVDKSKGNHDFLLCNNVDLSRPDVRNDLQNWAQWIGKELDLAGFRFDAAKHMSRAFMKEYVKLIRRTNGRDWLLVGEYCTYDDTKALVDYIRMMDGKMSLFDFPLVRNFTGISRHDDADLRFIFGDTLSEKAPANAVTFVTNHDTQEREDISDSRIEEDFLPVAYAVILLNRCSVYPCLFWGDLYGVNGPGNAKGGVHGKVIAKLALIRKLYAYGPQNDYYDDPSCVGFTRVGSPGHSNGAGVAIVISKSKREQCKRMNVGRHHAGEKWTEMLNGSPDGASIDNEGWGVFAIQANQGSGRVAVWGNSARQGQM